MIGSSYLYCSLISNFDDATDFVVDDDNDYDNDKDIEADNNNNNVDSTADYFSTNYYDKSFSSNLLC